MQPTTNSKNNNKTRVGWCDCCGWWCYPCRSWNTRSSSTSSSNTQQHQRRRQCVLKVLLPIIAISQLLLTLPILLRPSSSLSSTTSSLWNTVPFDTSSIGNNNNYNDNYIVATVIDTTANSKSSSSSSSSSFNENSSYDKNDDEINILLQQLRFCNDNENYNVTDDGSFRSSGEQQQQQQQQLCQWELCVPFQRKVYNNLKNIVDQKRYMLIYKLCNFYHFYSSRSSNNNNTIPQQQYNKFYNPSPILTRYIVCSQDNVTGRNTNIALTNKTTTILLVSSSSSSSDCINLYYQQQQYLSSIPLTNIFPQVPIELISNNKSHNTIPTEQIQQLAMYQEPMKVAFSSYTNYRTDLRLFTDCNIPCLYDELPGLIATRHVWETPDQSIWDITFSMEGPKYYPTLDINPSKYKQNQFWSTTSYESEIPLPYYSRAEYNIYHTNIVPFDVGIKGGAFLANNCQSHNNREGIIQELINLSNEDNERNNNRTAIFRVDSLSGCLHNAEPPDGAVMSNKISVMNKYLLYFAFENQNVDDYITEKLWGPMEAGTIPVYYGAPNIEQHVPYHSIIMVKDYKTTKDLYDHLVQVVHNRTLYESYHQWRYEPLPDHFLVKYDITDVHSTCRTCRWAYSRIHGIGWNHTTQSLRPLQNVRSRQVCLSSLSDEAASNNNNNNFVLVQSPFSEEWIDHNGKVIDVDATYMNGFRDSMNTFHLNPSSSGHDNVCRHPLNDTNHIISIQNGSMYRTVYYHDGIIDFIIDESSSNVATSTGSTATSPSLQLQLTMPVLQQQDGIKFRKVRDHVWHFQDAITRYTIVAMASTGTNKYNDTIRIQSKKETKTLLIQVTTPMRIRIIVEDVDTFHIGAENEENYFGKLMANDFLRPIERRILVPI